MNLDREIAEKVMGWRTGRLGTQSKMDPEDRGYYGGKLSNYGFPIKEWRPSKQIMQAMEVEAEMFRRRFEIFISRHGASFEVGFYKIGHHNTVSDVMEESLPEAICRAALAALEE